VWNKVNDYFSNPTLYQQVPHMDSPLPIWLKEKSGENINH
jgi:hypothetical protein